MLHVAFVWHMHQPLYKDRLTGEYLMPWVRLHGLKDYLDMVSILRHYPNLRQTFNLVPSLLEQIEDYAQGATDRALVLLTKPVPEWTASDRSHAMARFFDVQWDRMLAPFPRYHQLALKRNDLLAQFEPVEASRAFTHQDLVDLAVWFNLAWFDPLWRKGDPELESLVQRQQGFSAADRSLVAAKQRELLGRIIPEYSSMRNSGQIELSTTPFYHPILPLLVDSESARIARPNLPLPRARFSRRDDAREQIQRGLRFFEQRFAHRPAGMWPSEQSVSPAVLDLLAQEGIAWAISDEGILARSLGVRLVRDAAGQLLHPELLYRPYSVDTPSGRVAMVFRDVVLSDLIGFSYSRVPGPQAASDLHQRLKDIGRKSPDPHPLVTIALDGENCWEHYPEDGWDFLRAFYDAASRDKDMRLVTVSEYLTEHPPTHSLGNLFSGSWIGSDFTTWIGDPVKNHAWELLTAAREAFDSYSGPHEEEIYEELLTAEGSDWFWWFGSGHDSGQDELFDLQFRLRLQNAYRLMDCPVPKELAVPVSEVPKVVPVAASVGAFDPSSGQHVMHSSSKTLNRIEYRADSEALEIHLDLAPSFGGMAGDEVLIMTCYPGEVRFNSPINARPVPPPPGFTYRFLFAHEIRVGFEPLAATAYEAGEVYTWHALDIPVEVQLAGDLGVRIPVAALGQPPGREVHFVVAFSRKGTLLEVQPSDRMLAVTLPAPLPALRGELSLVKPAPIARPIRSEN